MPDYTVKQGDCISSIAKRNGLFWQKIWEHTNNSQLKQKRKDPNILYPGDIVYVPDKEVKEEPGATEQRHRFRRKGVPSSLLVRILNIGKPRRNEPFVLDIDGDLIKGNTDENGWINVSIPPDANSAKLTVGNEEIGQQHFDLDLGGMDPITEPSGIEKRLNNLGFDSGDEKSLEERIKVAISDFQHEYGLKITGEMDEPTRKKLMDVHGS